MIFFPSMGLEMRRVSGDDWPIKYESPWKDPLKCRQDFSSFFLWSDYHQQFDVTEKQYRPGGIYIFNRCIISLKARSWSNTQNSWTKETERAQLSLIFTWRRWLTSKTQALDLPCCSCIRCQTHQASLRCIAPHVVNCYPSESKHDCTTRFINVGQLCVTEHFCLKLLSQWQCEEFHTLLFIVLSK